MKLGKNGLLLLAGGAAVATIVALSCGKDAEKTVAPKKTTTEDPGNDDPVASDGDCGDGAAVSFCVSTGAVDKYAQGPAYEMTAVVADASLDSADANGYKLTSTLTKWHNLTASSNNDCAGNVTFAWNTAASAWVALVPKAAIAAVSTSDCKLVINADMGNAIPFADIKLLLGTKLNSTNIYNTASAPSAANSAACINCHSMATSLTDTPSGKFSLTSTDATTVSACSTDACRADLVDYNKLTDNGRHADFRVGTLTSSSPCVTLTEATTGIQTGWYVSAGANGTPSPLPIPAATTVSALIGGSGNSCTADQIVLSQNAAVSGTFQLKFSKVSGSLSWSTASASVPAAATIFPLASTTGFAVGDVVAIRTASSGGTVINRPGTTITAVAANSSVTLSAALTNQAAIGTGAQIVVTLPVVESNLNFCAYPATANNATTCYSETYKRVDKGSPHTSYVCSKVNSSGNNGTSLAQDNSLYTGAVPTGWAWPTANGNYPRKNIMPGVSGWMNAQADADKICRWILQGAPNT